MIDWPDFVLNPIRMQHRETGKVVRHGNGAPFNGRFQDGVEAILDRDALLNPLGKRKPRKILVCDTVDLFDDHVPDTWIDNVLAMAMIARQHTFQIVTRHQKRMAAYIKALDIKRLVRLAYGFFDDKRPRIFSKTLTPLSYGASHTWWRVFRIHEGLRNGLPLPNVWLGASIEGQADLEERGPIMYDLAIAGWNTFFLCDPLLGPLVNMARFLTRPPERRKSTDWDRGVSWIIIGGESGRSARPFDVAWARDIIQQCRKVGVPVFVKQLGARPIDSALRDIMYNGTAHYVRPADDPESAEAKATPGYSTVPHDMSRLLRHRKGSDPAEWPEELRVREFPA